MGKAVTGFSHGDGRGGHDFHRIGYGEQLYNIAVWTLNVIPTRRSYKIRFDLSSAARATKAAVISMVRPMPSMTASMWSQSMTIKPIRNEKDLRAAFKRLEVIFQAAAGTPEADEMEVLTTLIEAYENKHLEVAPTITEGD